MRSLDSLSLSSSSSSTHLTPKPATRLHFVFETFLFFNYYSLDQMLMKFLENLLVYMCLFILPSVSNCYNVKPMLCNISLTYSCPSSLYYVPDPPKTLQQTQSLFNVNSTLIHPTVDGFLIAVKCSCPADHDEFVSPISYRVQPGDTWDVLSSKFGSLLLEKTNKALISSQSVTLSLLCGCSESMMVVSYRVRPGDTLYTICSRFGASVPLTAQLNRMDNPGILHAGDVLFLPASPQDPKAPKNSKNWTRILGVLGATAAFFLLFSYLFWVFLLKRKGREQSSSPSVGAKYLFASFLPSKQSKQNELPLFNSDKSIVFSYDEVCHGTRNFSASQKVGQGSYGSVYRGHLRGSEVAIKQMKNTSSKEFLAEVNILCKVHHTNLIELIGYAAGGDSLFLVYEYAENGALSDHLRNPIIKGYAPLSWTRRVQIALDAAKGLEYIHLHTKSYYVHRDVKTSNILLDSNFRAKIADFGLVKLLENSPEASAATSKIVGTFGYLAPEYVREGCVTTKSDVYSFGVVLMELLTGQPALSRNTDSEKAGCTEHRSLVDLVLSALKDDHNLSTELTKCIDSNLGHYHRDSLFQMALLSKDCVDDDWKRRPDMCQVVLRLSYILACTLQGEGKEASHPYLDVSC